MSFSLESILEFSRSVESQCGRQGVPAKFFKKNWIENAEWVVTCQSNLRKEPSQKNLECYAQAIHLAAQFLKSQEQASTTELGFLSQHLFTLDSEARVLLPNAVLNFPKPVDETKETLITQQFEQLKTLFLSGVDSSIGQIEEEYRPTPAVQVFLNSDEFTALKKYRDTVLKNDKRDHTFFGIDFALTMKYKALDLLINAFEQQKTLEGIDNVMKTFYNTKNKSTREAKSIYDYLNTGQNLFTWFFGLFVKTTTVTLIDSLKEFMEENFQDKVERELEHPCY
ncbi:hypothetical protein [Legionella maceachernii]|uniref:Uncharacterized protein n=1 Tax=Legionella maceachernii TaxID=466 RepID=A0A0W0VXY8_9GAMM|nr:hypothetical protein [Legionella maceachernii]KTD24927.1 hypothetical protein Lmac_2464 [Legionella maceachernii]SKA16488.1 hypothetical protein SAMN02745128_02372 [Legionella maceachernii]SUP01661.1 Uncharacterised protein [Legionella maceachernii]